MLESLFKQHIFLRTMNSNSILNNILKEQVKQCLHKISLMFKTIIPDDESYNEINYLFMEFDNCVEVFTQNSMEANELFKRVMLLMPNDICCMMTTRHENECCADKYNHLLSLMYNVQLNKKDTETLNICIEFIKSDDSFEKYVKSHMMLTRILNIVNVFIGNRIEKKINYFKWNDSEEQLIENLRRDNFYTFYKRPKLCDSQTKVCIDFEEDMFLTRLKKKIKQNTGVECAIDHCLEHDIYYADYIRKDRDFFTINSYWCLKDEK